MAKAVSIGHGDSVAWREHTRLAIGLELLQKYLSVLLPAQDAAHACWEAIWPMAVDIPHSWATWFRLSATGAGRFHGSSSNLENSSYVLVNFCDCVSFFFFLGASYREIC
jgi:hypothetical protein